MSDHFWWYVARSSGILSWILLTGTVVWGILMPAKVTVPGVKRRVAWILDLHRWLGSLSLWFLALHLGALIADSYTDFSIADVFVPMLSDWKPGPVAFGVVAMWLLLAVQGTSLLMVKLPRRLWRQIHLTSYVSFGLVIAHSALAGTDSSNRLFAYSMAGSVLLVVGATIYRIAVRRDSPTKRTV